MHSQQWGRRVSVNTRTGFEHLPPVRSPRCVSCDTFCAFSNNIPLVLNALFYERSITESWIMLKSAFRVQLIVCTKYISVVRRAVGWSLLPHREILANVFACSARMFEDIILILYVFSWLVVLGSPRTKEAWVPSQTFLAWRTSTTSALS